jgi:hypothetical protein
MLVLSDKIRSDADAVLQVVSDVYTYVTKSYHCYLQRCVVGASHQCGD